MLAAGEEVAEAGGGRQVAGARRLGLLPREVPADRLQLGARGGYMNRGLGGGAKRRGSCLMAALDDRGVLGPPLARLLEGGTNGCQGPLIRCHQGRRQQELLRRHAQGLARGGWSGIVAAVATESARKHTQREKHSIHTYMRKKSSLPRCPGRGRGCWAGQQGAWQGRAGPAWPRGIEGAPGAGRSAARCWGQGRSNASRTPRPAAGRSAPTRKRFPEAVEAEHEFQIAG